MGWPRETHWPQPYQYHYLRLQTDLINYTQPLLLHHCINAHGWHPPWELLHNDWHCPWPPLAACVTSLVSFNPLTPDPHPGPSAPPGQLPHTLGSTCPFASYISWWSLEIIQISAWGVRLLKQLYGYPMQWLIICSFCTSEIEIHTAHRKTVNPGLRHFSTAINTGNTCKY